MKSFHKKILILIVVILIIGVTLGVLGGLGYFSSTLILTKNSNVDNLGSLTLTTFNISGNLSKFGLINNQNTYLTTDGTFTNYIFSFNINFPQCPSCTFLGLGLAIQLLNGDTSKSTAYIRQNTQGTCPINNNTFTNIKCDNNAGLKTGPVSFYYSIQIPAGSIIAFGLFGDNSIFNNIGYSVLISAS